MKLLYYIYSNDFTTILIKNEFHINKRWCLRFSSKLRLRFQLRQRSNQIAFLHKPHCHKS